MKPSPQSDAVTDYADLEKRLREESRDRDHGYRAQSFLADAADALASLTRELEEAKARVPQWLTMDKRPEDLDCFLAAVEVRNNRTGEDYWDIHLVTLDDETGEINEDTGWTLDDYTWFAPRPLPPSGIGDVNNLSRGQSDPTETGRSE